ncbi:uncharacterized protein OCT59_023926 [Rhizophagus irregularis]|uniref:uncharacterized protein n=1 Tax=Rhizophagus irregularis TaxID=588596 RepID=UPI00333108C7|nr:hypothetical protein OCT59_023926 [Rhizophagus irregularis]
MKKLLILSYCQTIVFYLVYLLSVYLLLGPFSSHLFRSISLCLGLRSFSYKPLSLRLITIHKISINRFINFFFLEHIL